METATTRTWITPTVRRGVRCSLCAPATRGPHHALFCRVDGCCFVGQHRWVEFKDIHNPDAASISPDWHGWHTQMQDAPGSSVRGFLDERLTASKQVAGDDADSRAAFADHVGLNASGYELEKTMNPTMQRARGYKIGGTMNSSPTDADKFYVHPGHALNKGKVGRFQGQKKMHLWDGSEDNEPPKPIRDPMIN